MFPVLIGLFLLGCSDDEACKDACSTASDNGLTACNTALDICLGGLVVRDLAEDCQALVLDSYELVCDEPEEESRWSFDFSQFDWYSGDDDTDTSPVVTTGCEDACEGKVSDKVTSTINHCKDAVDTCNSVGVFVDTCIETAVELAEEACAIL